MHVVGLMLHPERDCGGAVASVLDWADQRGIEVLGIDSELSRLACSANPVSAEELRQRADLLVSMGGDGTMLRAMRLADGQRFPVLGVNLGKLGFLAEVDVPQLPDALSAIDAHSYTTEPRLAVDAVIGDRTITAFNDFAFVRFPGHKTAAVAVRAAKHPFVSYAADAIVVATPTGSTAYSFSAGGPIVSPGVECLVVTPVAPHSAYNRGLVLAADDQLALEILPSSGRLAVEADGISSAEVGPGDQIELMPRPGAARVVRLGRTTFYQRARRKLRLTDSAEIPATFGDGEEIIERVAAIRDLPARPPRQRAALAPVADRGELGRIPAGPAHARRAGARRGLRPGHDHRRPGRPGTRRPGHRDRRGGRRAGRSPGRSRAARSGQHPVRDR
jgi:NAD+ kinase